MVREGSPNILHVISGDGGASFALLDWSRFASADWSLGRERRRGLGDREKSIEWVHESVLQHNCVS